MPSYNSQCKGLQRWDLAPLHIGFQKIALEVLVVLVSSEPEASPEDLIRASFFSSKLII